MSAITGMEIENKRPKEDMAYNIEV